MSRAEIYQGYKNYEVAYDKIETEMFHRASGGRPTKEYEKVDFGGLAKMKRQVVVEIIKLRKDAQALYGDGDFGHEKSIQNWEDILRGLPS